MVAIAALFLLATARPAQAAEGETVKLLISVRQATVVEPYPARITLNLHNASQQLLWFYHRALAPQPPAALIFEENRQQTTSGGATLAVKLEPTGAGDPQPIAEPAHGEVLEWVGLPRPNIVSVAPGDDYEEKDLLSLTPAMAEGHKPIWGSYRLSVVYEARFSNAGEVRHLTGSSPWEGKLTSNAVNINLQPAPPDAKGSVEGTVVGTDLQPHGNERVTLSGNDEQIIGQVVTEPEGRFSFTHLPLGTYWVTARRQDSDVDTTVFQHIDLTSAEPIGTLQLVQPRPEIYEAKKMLHKPVIFRVVDPAGNPFDGVRLGLVWSTGTVLETLQGETGGDGIAALDLLPGRNFVTLKHGGCKKQEERADVAPGSGVDAFRFVFNCARR